MDSSKLPINILYLISFFEGSVVIFAELIGAKLLHGFYGSTLTVWSIVLCTTISSLTLGYFIGGKFSKKPNKVIILSRLFALSAFFIISIPLFFEKLVVQYSQSDIQTATISTAILILAPAIISLGATTPIIIQLITDKLNRGGTASGNTYAISTLAGIVTTLFIGYILLPYFGTKLPLIISGVILIPISIILNKSTFNVLIGILSFLIIIPVFKENENEDKNITLIHQSEGMMGQLKIIEQNGFRLLLINGIPQTVIKNNKNALSFWEYAYKISAVSTLKKGKRALLIGMGGGVVANELQKLNFTLDIVDIDKRMYQFSKEYFYFNPLKSTHFYEDDARHFIKQSQKKYDLIILDIFAGEVQPSNVFTNEGVKDLKKIMSEDAFVFIQNQEIIDKNKISGIGSITKTLLNNKFKVYKNIEKIQNIENLNLEGVILAFSKKEINFDKLDQRNFTQNTQTQNWFSEYKTKIKFIPILKPQKNSIILYDDVPNLEIINLETSLFARRIMNTHYGIKLIK